MKETIIAVLKDLKGKTPEEKVLSIHRQLGVQVAEIETTYFLDILKGIIEARIIDFCPICKGFGFDAEFKECFICNGVGYLKAVEAEKRMLLWKAKKDKEYKEYKEKLKEKIEVFWEAYFLLKEKMGTDFFQKDIGTNILKKIDKLNWKIYLS
ncbi:MAG: hypothetical protein AAB696_01905 [Patescibacteria group bacterium]